MNPSFLLILLFVKLISLFNPKSGLQNHPSMKITTEISSFSSCTYSCFTDIVNILQPQCIRKDTSKAFQWRIRNLPYPLSTYSVTIDENGTTITVRTSNKKYFKKIPVPDIERRKLKMDKKFLTFAHANNTLIIQVSCIVTVTHSFSHRLSLIF